MPLPAIAAGAVAIAPYIVDIIKRIIPDPEEQAKATHELNQLALSGELQLIAARLSAIIAEANAEDKWTSRARPSFLYVIYTLILAAIPMGVLYAYNPETATQITIGFKEWLYSIPEPLWWLFGTGYLGYTGAREIGKYNAMKDKQWKIVNQ